MLDSETYTHTHTHAHLNLYSPIRVRSIFWYPRCPTTIDVNAACLFRFVRPLPIFHSRSIYLVPIVQKFSYNFPTHSSHPPATRFLPSRKEVLKGYLFRVECIECFNKAFLKVLFSWYVYTIFNVIQSRVFFGKMTYWRDLRISRQLALARDSLAQASFISHFSYGKTIFPP